MMNEENFLSFLQQLMTMADPDNEEEVMQARNALIAVVELALSSGKVNRRTAAMMHEARFRFLRLHKYYRHHFVGVPGEYQRNALKRQRLADALLASHC